MLAIDAVATPFPALTLAMGAARFTPVHAVAHQERLVVHQRPLNARPGAHVGAHLLTREAAQHVGGHGENADEEIRDGRSFKRDKLHRQRGRISKIEYPGAAGRHGNQQPDAVLQHLASKLARAHRLLLKP